MSGNKRERDPIFGQLDRLAGEGTFDGAELPSQKDARRAYLAKLTRYRPPTDIFDTYDDEEN